MKKYLQYSFKGFVSKEMQLKEHLRGRSLACTCLTAADCQGLCTVSWCEEETWSTSVAPTCFTCVSQEAALT